MENGKGSRLMHLISQNMMMEFCGKSCNVVDSNGNLVANFGEADGLVTKEVFADYRCYVIRADVKFEKSG